MPIVTATPRGLQNGKVITEFTDVTSTASITYTYPVQQSAISVENSGMADIFVSVGIYTNQLIKPDSKWRADVNFGSFSIRSDANSQEFIATAFQNDIDGSSNQKPFSFTKNYPVPSGQVVTSPLNLHFNIKKIQRELTDAYEDEFIVIKENFVSPDVGSTQEYARNTASGSGTTTVGGGKLSITAGSGGAYKTFFRSRSQVVIPHLTLETTVMDFNGTAELGLMWANSLNYRFGLQYGSGSLTLFNIYNGAVVTTDYQSNVTTSVALTPPFSLKLVIGYPEIVAYVKRGGGYAYEPLIYGNVSPQFSLKTPADISAWTPYFGGDVPASTTLSFTNFNVRYQDVQGLRDPKIVTYLDGTPLIKNGKYLLSFTVATVGHDYKCNHWAIGELDPVSYNFKVLSHLFFNIGGNVTSLYPGQILYDDIADEWILVNSSWGYVSGGAPMYLYLSKTDADITRGIHVLDTTRINLPDNGINAWWDPSIRKENGQWKLVVAEGDNVTGGQTALYTGNDIVNGLTRQAKDTTRFSEGQQWFKVGGKWYCASAQFNPSSGWAVYDSDLNFLGLATNWRANIGTAPLFVASAAPSPHPCILPVSDYDKTRYLLITFDQTTVLAGKATGGALVVMEASETVSGYEFPKKKLLR